MVEELLIITHVVTLVCYAAELLKVGIAIILDKGESKSELAANHRCHKYKYSQSRRVSNGTVASPLNTSPFLGSYG